MNKFTVGQEVLFQGNRGVVREKDSFNDEWEYAVEFDDPSGMENLFGCTIVENGSVKEIIPMDRGAWIMEDGLEVA